MDDNHPLLVRLQKLMDDLLILRRKQIRYELMQLLDDLRQVRSEKETEEC
jgi:hypothetical protein